MVLASYPGLFTTSPPGDASSFGVYWPALVPDDVVQPRGGDGRGAHPDRSGAGGRPRGTERAESFRYSRDGGGESARWPEALAALRDAPAPPSEDTTTAPLGRAFGARSGDKGGNANLGVWARTDDAYVWLHRHLTVERLRELMPAETEGLEVLRYELPNLRALNFVIVGLLGPRGGRARPAPTRRPRAWASTCGPRSSTLPYPAARRGTGCADGLGRCAARPPASSTVLTTTEPGTAAMHFTAEHEQFRSTVRQVVEREIDPYVDEWEEAGIFPAHELFPKLAAAGLLGLEYDPAYGGQGADHSYTVIFGEEVGRAGCGGVPMAISVQTDMATPSLHRFGSPRAQAAVPGAGHRGARWWPPSR